jgi:hypothetical protein
MPQYVCLDGPLAGHVFDWRDTPSTGETVTVAVVDVGQDDVVLGPPEADYLVERSAAPREAGRLRFVTHRGAWDVPALAGDVPLERPA